MSADSIIRKGVYTKGFTLWASLEQCLTLGQGSTNDDPTIP